MAFDFRYSVRALLKNPAFTILAALTIALGIGANTAIFTVVKGVLLKPLPFPESERLVAVSCTSAAAPDMRVSNRDYEHWREHREIFADMCARVPAGGIITGIGEPERVFGRYVSASFFSTLKFQPALGRVFTEIEDRPGVERVMIISDALWRRRFDADPAIVGRVITYGGEPWTIIGVLSRNFDLFGLKNVNNDVILPLGQISDQSIMHDPQSRPLHVLARLAPGVSRAQAQKAMDTLAAQLASQHPDSNTGVGIRILPLLDYYLGDDTKPALMVIAGGAFVLLLIACANVANLTLARATTRAKEIAVRIAVGGSRGQIVGLLLSESLLIAAFGGLLGVFLAYWLVGIFRTISEEIVPRIDTIQVDLGVLAFSGIVILLATLVFGLAPAIHAARTDVEAALKSGSRESSGISARRLRGSAVVVQLALALMLLIGAALITKSFSNIMRVDPGLDPKNVLTFRLRLPDAKYSDLTAAKNVVIEARRRIGELPGVEAVAVTSGVPLRRGSQNSYAIEGELQPQNVSEWPVAMSLSIDENYFRALGVTLLAGRTFTDRDTETAPPVAIVDDQFVRRHFGSTDPGKALGHRVRFSGDDEPWREIVGIVRHVIHDGLEERPRAGIYSPWTQLNLKANPLLLKAMDFVVKGSRDPATLTSPIRAELRQIDPDLPLSDTSIMTESFRESTGQRRFNLLLIGSFAMVALTLGAIGLFGVMNYSVSQRTREMGIRMAIGARPADVLRLILSEGFMLAVIGTLLGIGGGLALTRLLSSVLFGVSTNDPIIYVATAALLLIIALAASFWPARRAANVQPLEALRYE
jgi:putative ABC transport system permease protein